jgi:TolB-like protein
MADGLTEAVINTLSQVPGLRVVPRSTAFQYKGRELDVTNVALALNVRSIVTGRVVTHADLVTIQAELIDAATEAQVWGHQYRCSMSEVLAFEDDAAKQIAMALNVRFSLAELKRLRRRATLDTKAYHEYLRGRHQWARYTGEGLLQAIGHFERAIDSDPAFALAWSGLAEALVLAGFYAFVGPADAMARGMQAAQRALDLDPTLGEAHAAIGFARLFSEWDGEGAEAALHRAVEINPHLAIAHAYLGLVLDSRGRRSEAVAATQRACELEPFSLMTGLLRGWVLWHCGEYEAALTQAHRLVEHDEASAGAHAISILCHEALGRLDRAADEWALGVDVFGQGQDRDRRLKTALTRNGSMGYWEERLALARGVSGSANGVALLAQAQALAALGRLDEGLAVLDGLVTARFPQAVFLGMVPFVQAYQSHPGFSALLERVGMLKVQTAR